jgi:hypothetical protein
MPPALIRDREPRWTTRSCTATRGQCGRNVRAGLAAPRCHLVARGPAPHTVRILQEERQSGLARIEEARKFAGLFLGLN